jgi:hypothetical protein
MTLQDLLGHSSIVVTADTYTSVLPDSQRRCAEAAATRSVTESDDTHVPPTRHPTSTKAEQRERPEPRFRSSGP